MHASWLFACDFDLERDFFVLLADLTLPDFRAGVGLDLPFSLGSLGPLVLKSLSFEFALIEHLDPWLLLALGSVFGLGKARRSLVKLGLAPICDFPRIGVADFAYIFGVVFVRKQI